LKHFNNTCTTQPPILPTLTNEKSPEVPEITSCKLTYCQKYIWHGSWAHIV